MSLGEAIKTLLDAEAKVKEAEEHGGPSFREERALEDAEETIFTLLWDRLEPKIDRLIERHVLKDHDGHDLY